jgi:hypothetical protein
MSTALIHCWFFLSGVGVYYGEIPLDRGDLAIIKTFRHDSEFEEFCINACRDLDDAPGWTRGADLEVQPANGVSEAVQP